MDWSFIVTADGAYRLHPVPPQSAARCDAPDEKFFTQRAVPSLWCLRWVCRENNVPIMQGKTPLFRWLKSALVESMPESMGRREWMRGMAASALAGSGLGCLSGRRPDAGGALAAVPHSLRIRTAHAYRDAIDIEH